MIRRSSTRSAATTSETRRDLDSRGGSGYVGKPRPVAVIQDDRFDATESVTICAFTTDPTEAPLFRLRVEPSTANGLHEDSSLMVDKITTVHRSRLSEQ